MEGKKAKVAGVALSALLCVVFLLVREPVFITEHRVFGAFVHHFFHVNVLHLIVNCYAVIVLFGRKVSLSEIIPAYIIATVSFFISPATPIGFSNMLYAIMGIRTPSFRSPWWRSVNTIIFLVVMFAYLFVPNVSAITHIFCFFAGVWGAVGARFLDKIFSDYGKANKR